jgi:electron transfer flavoprotein beta subunit
MVMPCIVGAAKGLNRPRCPTLPGMMKAKKKEITIVDIADLDIPNDSHAVDLIGLQPVPDRGRGRILEGNPQTMVQELLRLLREEAKVL